MCEYCQRELTNKGHMFGKNMKLMRQETDFSDMLVYLHDGETPCLMAFDTAGRSAYVDVNYCPMCGRKLGCADNG